MGGNNTSPAVDVAREKVLGEDNTVTLPNGVKVRINPVGAALISDVTSRIKDPEIPVVYIADKERNEPNPNDPNYLRGLEEANQKRGIAMIDTLVMFGVELLDGIPEDDEWMKKLTFMVKRGLLDLSGYDLDDSFDREFLYKRYILVDNTVISMVTDASGLSTEDISRAEASFPSK